jgi:hypothetical protein
MYLTLSSQVPSYFIEGSGVYTLQIHGHVYHRLIQLV